MEDKFEKIITIMGIIVSIVIIFITIIFTCIFLEMLNDHRCYTMPLNEFYQDKRCEKYWDMRNWEDGNN